MKKNKPLFIAIAVFFILTTGLFLGNTDTAGAKESCSIVTIRGRDNIEPNMLTIKKGDCVVWMNFNDSPGSLNQEIILSFKLGEKCIKSTRSPVGFKMDTPSGCYIAGWFDYGQTSSLVFAEPGTYSYEVQFKAGGKNSGTIVVK